MTSLRDLPDRCFAGTIPSAIATSAADGTPNSIWISQVFRADDHHVALSCQFFKKTRANLAVEPRACILVVDPTTARQWRLAVRFLRAETSGALFDDMKKDLEVIASATGMAGVFVLESADLFEVMTVEEIITTHDALPAPSAGPDALVGLSRLTERVALAKDLGALVDSGLDVLVTHLGYEKVTLYLNEKSENVHYALASRGAGTSGTGARFPLDVGVVGACARHRMPIRIADLHHQARYGQTIRDQRGTPDGEIAAPALPKAKSILAVPLLLDGEIFGVLVAESEREAAFTERDTQLLSTAGQLLVQGIALHHEDDEEPISAPEPTQTTGVLRVKWYEADDSVLLDGEYLIKGLPGRILWLLLSLREQEQRDTFTNRELRLHPLLKLPAYKDNLETRLLMLQRRLDEKGSALRIKREARGRLDVTCDKQVALERVPA